VQGDAYDADHCTRAEAVRIRIRISASTSTNLAASLGRRAAQGVELLLRRVARLFQGGAALGRLCGEAGAVRLGGGHEPELGRRVCRGHALERGLRRRQLAAQLLARAPALLRQTRIPKCMRKV